MSKIAITVVDPQGTYAYDVELPDDMKVQEFLPGLLQKMGIKDDPNKWALNQVSNSHILNPHETLKDAGVAMKA